jgi:hypothetical protein
MRLALASLFVLGLMTCLSAADLVTRQGKVYHNYKVIDHDDGFVTILYSDGGGKIPLKDLPDDLQKQYGYDPAKAAAFVKQFYEADAQQRLAVREAQAPTQTFAGPNGEPGANIGSGPAFSQTSATPEVSPIETSSSTTSSGLQLGADPLAPEATVLHIQGDEASSDADKTPSNDSSSIVYGSDTSWDGG